MIVNSPLFRRIELQLLMNITARAIGRPSKRIWTLPNDQALTVYAEYTRDNLKGDPDQQILGRMNEEACRMGRRLRTIFRLSTTEEVEKFATLLYDNIGIELSGHLPGRLCFKKCFFSKYYTPSICLAASALDEGIMKGLSGDGHLHFEQRITEGCKSCIASFTQDT